MIQTFNAAWLLEQEFAPLQYAIPGLIPEGLSLLVGGPKAGKSWFCLDLGYAAATGGVALGGIRVDRRPVLYMALEDGQRRLQSRLRTLGYLDGGEDLHFVVTVDQENPPETVIGGFLDVYSERSPLVILDTLGKVMPPARGSEGAYERDYRVAGGLKSLVDQHPGSSLIVVHHTNKAAHGDFVDKVSGTNGIAGAADSILVLARDRDETTATLSVTSRDAAEGIYQVEQPSVGRWELSGGSLEQARGAHQQAKITEGVGESMTEVIRIINDHPDGLTIGDVSRLTGIDPKKVSAYLSRAVEAGRVHRPKRGTYTPVGTVGSVGNEIETNTPNTTNRDTQGVENDELDLSA